MVHRPSDSRLLVNLLDHEKDYSKQLSTLLDKSQSSLASFSAYASASAPPTSQIIIQVAGALAGADEALRKYATSLEQWQEQLKSLKALEDGVGNVMRDREILVTRLIKLSKSQKPTRDSILASSSTSTLTKLPEVQTSTKLAAAQSELQACEAHLATKERELDAMRNTAFVYGLSARCKALVECGWTWGEMGKEGLRALESMEGSLHTSNGNGYAMTSPTLRAYKPLPEGPSSDLSSIGPSQSASQTTHATNEPLSSVPARLHIPPAHSISDHTFPVEEEEPGGGSSADEEEDGYEVRENERFAKRSSKVGKKTKSSMDGHNDGREKFSSVSSASAPPGSTAKRTRRTSGHGSVLGSIAAFFRGAPPADSEQRAANESSPTKKYGRWQTRTDKHLAKKRKGKGSDSDEDLTIKQRSPVVGFNHPPMISSGSAQKLKKASAEPSRRTVKSFSMTHIEPVDLSQGVLSDGGVDRRNSRRTKKVRRASADHAMSDPETLPTPTKKKKPPVDIQIVEHRGKDASPTTLTASPSRTRKSSLGHASQKPNGSLPAALPTEAPLSLSRNSSLSKRSITSAASAPVNLSAMSSKSKATIHPAGSSPLNPTAHRRSASLNARPDDLPAESSAKKHKRGNSVTNPPANSSRSNLPGNQSLMSIVEDVAQQNREWRVKQDPNLMLFIAKAPPPIAEDLLKMPDGPIHVPPPAASKSTPTPTKTLPPRDKTASQRSIPLTPTAPAPTAPVVHVPSPDMKPLRSAMRNTSRSPSPIVLSLPPANSTSTSTLQLPLGPTKPQSSPIRDTPPPLESIQSVGNDAVEDDTSSISSYETTNDVLVEEPDQDEHEHEHEHGTPSFSVYDTPTLPTPKVQSQPPPAPPPKEIPASGSDSSQLSQSTGSTTLATNSNPPTRRKSVRMSLPPTFSATPPAIEDDEGDKRRYEPWSSPLSVGNGNGNGNGVGGGGWRSRIKEPPVQRDVWHDSSESEDEEYSKAKRLLGRLSRKK